MCPQSNQVSDVHKSPKGGFQEMLSRALAGRCRRLVRANEVGRRRGFFSWLKSGSTEEKKSHILPDGSFLPMIESPYPEVRSLGQSYAQGGVGCGKCKEAKLYSCPQSGIPSHCKKECYDEDKVHQENIPKLREMYEDLVDLRSGRKFPEFDFPGPPPHEWQRAELINWRAFLSDRRFKWQDDKTIGWARGEEELAREEQSIRHISSIFTFPLTIAHAIYWQAALGDPAKLDRKDDEGKLIPWRIGILGPRKEATMPIRAWVELCAVFPEAAFHIHLCGPEISDELHEKEMTVIEGKLSITWTKAEYQEVNEYFPMPDMFVAFNSGMGFGGDYTWDGALDIVFNGSGFKPLLLTSHNMEDAARDYAYLSRRQDCRFIMHPAVNPFMSLRNDAAVNDIRYIINSNHTYSIARGSPPIGVIAGDTIFEKIKNALR